jgi:tetratricopeptide repeat protein 27
MLPSARVVHGSRHNFVTKRMFDVMMLPDACEAAFIRSGEYLKVLDSSTPLISGIAHLLLFIQVNWTGPPHQDFPLDSQCDASQLEVDGEVPYVLTKRIELLIKAQKLLKYRGEGFIEDWWCMRMLFIKQRILENAVPALKKEITAIIAQHDTRLMWTHLVEASLIFTFYEDERKASACLSRAAKMLGFSYELTGVMGKRMKHQQLEVTQLIVSTNERGESEGASPNSMDIRLQDDDILDELKFEKKVTQPSHVAILLTHAALLNKFSARDEAQRVRMQAFISACLECTTWSLQTTAFYLRSITECTQAKYIERAALQLQALADQVTNASGTTPAQERLLYFFQTLMPSTWEMDKMQGKLFASLGLFRTALRVFERIQMWEDVVVCLVQLGEEESAGALINELLQKSPSIQQRGKLLCILGDLKNDPAYYHSAWNGCKSVRAKRSLGRIAFKTQDWEGVIEHLSIALMVNSLFSNSWFLLGCAQMQLSKWDDAATSFNRVISLDGNNGDAWNNMAVCHKYADRQLECLQALQQAARLNWEDWRVWDNVATEAVAVKDQQIAVQACKRMLEINDCGASAESLLDLAHHIILMSDESVKNRVDELLLLMQTKFPSNFKFHLLQADWHSITQNTGSEREALWTAYRNLKAQMFYRNACLFEELVKVMERLGAMGEMDKDTVEVVRERVKESMNDTDAYKRLLSLSSSCNS